MNRLAPLSLGLLLIAGCTVPPYQPVTDPGFAGIAAQATGTRAAADVAATAAAGMATGQAIVAAQNAQMTGTAVSVQATAQSVQATAAVQAQETAVSQATAAAYQASQEEIDLMAQGTRMKLETDATATAVWMRTQSDIDKAERAEWFWFAFLIILLAFLAGIGYAAGKIMLRNANTVRDSSGEVIAYRNHFLLPESIAPPIIEQAAGYVTHNSRNGSQGIDRYRQPANLEAGDGRLVYRFSGRQLDAMENNILNGDSGFRRDTSGQGSGLDTLIGLRNGSLFSAILDEMKRRDYVAENGYGHVWTRRGMTEFLHMTTLPH
jgi:hypothetical protein